MYNQAYNVDGYSNSPLEQCTINQNWAPGLLYGGVSFIMPVLTGFSAVASLFLVHGWACSYNLTAHLQSWQRLRALLDHYWSSKLHLKYLGRGGSGRRLQLVGKQDVVSVEKSCKSQVYNIIVKPSFPSSPVPMHLHAYTFIPPVSQVEGRVQASQRSQVAAGQKLSLLLVIPFTFIRINLLLVP